LGIPTRGGGVPAGRVRDANGQALVYIYSRESEAEAMQAKVLTKDEARRIAVNVAKLPDPLGKAVSIGEQPWTPMWNAFSRSAVLMGFAATTRRTSIL
jgi:hypothetical protein